MEIFFTILIMTLVVSLSGVVTRVLPFQCPPALNANSYRRAAGVADVRSARGVRSGTVSRAVYPAAAVCRWLENADARISGARARDFGLALALVVVTVVGIGFLIYWAVPGIPLIPAFALAAVLSPTDAVALSGIVGEGRIPKKIMGILQGEALMNDASGLSP